MAQIYYDFERLRQAVVILLNMKFGEERSAKLRLRIERIPARTQSFYQNLEPLNEFLLVARQSKSKALELLDLVDARREKFIERYRTEDPKKQQVRDRNIQSMRLYRERLSLAVKIEEVKTGKTMSPAEAKAYKKKMAAEWTKRRRAYQKETGLAMHEAATRFNSMLFDELHEEYQKAMRAVENRKLSDPSLRRLQEKKSPDLTAFAAEFNRKHRGKDG